MAHVTEKGMFSGPLPAFTTSGGDDPTSSCASTGPPCAGTLGMETAITAAIALNEIA